MTTTTTRNQLIAQVLATTAAYEGHTVIYMTDEELREVRDQARRERQMEADRRRVAAEHRAKCPELAGLDW